MAISPGALAPKLREKATEEGKAIIKGFGEIRIIDYLFGISMIFIGISVAGLPFGTVTAGLLVVIALSRSARVANPMVGVFGTLMMLTIFYAAVMSYTFGISEPGQIVRRVVRIAIVIFLVMVIADKRVDFKSMTLGMATGLIANVPVFYAGLNSNNYGGHLTGWINDKNQSGLWYATVGLTVVVAFEKRLHRFIAIPLFLVMIYLTGSRTSTAAFIFGVLWLAIAPKLNIISKIGLAAFIVWAVDWLTENLAQNEAFGDRTGTDALRERIDEASYEKVQLEPWTGLGYGQATVEVQDLTFFFHNSFWTLMVEAGWFYMLAVVFMSIWAVLLLKQPQEKLAIDRSDAMQKKLSSRKVMAEATMVLLFICSWRLGEVFLTVPWAMAVGLGLSYLATPKNRAEEYGYSEPRSS